MKPVLVRYNHLQETLYEIVMLYGKVCVNKIIIDE